MAAFPVPIQKKGRKGRSKEPTELILNQLGAKYVHIF